MHILIIKMTSLGDVVHMLPALTEAVSHISNLRVDWVVEEGFAAIPGWHPAVESIIPSALRRWRRQLGKDATWREMGQFRRALQASEYDLVLDAQGLIKSALVARLVRGPRVGLAWGSAREGLASLAYTRSYAVAPELHAITRNRLFMAQALGYRVGEEADIRYGLAMLDRIAVPGLLGDYVMCMHGTARSEKEYPELDWIVLLKQITARGLAAVLPWGNEREHSRALRLAAVLPGVVVLPKMGLAELAGVIAGARAVLGVDTGLMHLAAALLRPGVGLYPATPPERFGVRNELDAPVMVNLSSEVTLRPDHVYQVISAALKSSTQRL